MYVHCGPKLTFIHNTVHRWSEKTKKDCSACLNHTAVVFSTQQGRVFLNRETENEKQTQIDIERQRKGGSGAERARGCTCSVQN